MCYIVLIIILTLCQQMKIMQHIQQIQRTVWLLLFTIMVAAAGAQKPAADKKLYAEIAHMDSVLFTAFNSKNLEAFKNIFDKDLEFYHDKGGLSNYAANIEASKSMFARVPDLHRTLLAGSLEVYPIPGYGAIQVGIHRFCHRENGKDDCGNFKFLHIWKQTPEGWKLARVVSYDH